MTGTATELSADVGWLACTCTAGTGSILSAQYQAGVIAGDSDLATTILFATAFDDPPRVFASIVSSADLSSHLRLSETVSGQASLATEYDTCSAVFANSDTSIAWIALAATPGESVRVSQRQTLPSDTVALLAMGTALRLPEYFHWRNSSDPCRDRWSGIQCRTDAEDTPRIVVLDIHNVDLTNQDILWSAISKLTALEEILMWNCGLTGVINAEFLCLLTELQVLALNRNNLHGTVPECMIELPLQVLFLNNNNVYGPLAELSLLGQFLIKAVPSLSLERNRWAPLLASEKQALAEVSAPLQVETHEHEHNWDFVYSCEWQ